MDASDLPQVVRERIPEMLAATGVRVQFEPVATDELWLLLLTDKLDQLVKQYMATGDAEYLMDLVDVTFTLSEARGVTRIELLNTLSSKTAVLGDFRHRRVLTAVPRPG